VAEWLSRQPRDQTKERAKARKGQDSWWASCSQGFESLPRRHLLNLNCSVLFRMLFYSLSPHCFGLFVGKIAMCLRLLVESNELQKPTFRLCKSNDMFSASFL
jgi:hypothetical protein